MGVQRAARLVFLGGDARDAAAAQILASVGYAVSAFPDFGHTEGGVCSVTEAIASAHAVIGPALGAVAGGRLFCAPPSPPLAVAEDWWRATPPGCPWLVGRADAALRAAAAAHGVRLVEYGEREEYAIANAVPTAEGAIAEACRLARRGVWRSRALVLGLGRCGLTLVARLVAWGAQVAGMDRDRARAAQAEVLGARIIEGCALPAAASDCHFVFNTVPAMPLTAVLAALPPEALVLDLAFPPAVAGSGGPPAGAQLARASSIPARLLPLTGGAILAEVLVAMLPAAHAVQTTEQG